MSEQAKVIRWEKPPPSRRTGTARGPGSRYAAVADELRSNPGAWAVIEETGIGGRTALAHHVRLGAMACFSPTGDFDAVARRIDGRTVIYARYVGDEEAGHA